MKFPKQIYVGYESDEDDEEFPVASEDPGALAAFNGNREVGVYQLVRVAVLENKSTII